MRAKIAVLVLTLFLAAVSSIRADVTDLGWTVGGFEDTATSSDTWSMVINDGAPQAVEFQYGVYTDGTQFNGIYRPIFSSDQNVQSVKFSSSFDVSAVEGVESALARVAYTDIFGLLPTIEVYSSAGSIATSFNLVEGWFEFLLDSVYLTDGAAELTLVFTFDLSKGSKSVDFGVNFGDITIKPVPDPPVSQVPEPATMLIFGLGLAGAGIAAYRRKK